MTSVDIACWTALAGALGWSWREHCSGGPLLPVPAPDLAAEPPAPTDWEIAVGRCVVQAIEEVRFDKAIVGDGFHAVRHLVARRADRCDVWITLSDRRPVVS